MARYRTNSVSDSQSTMKDKLVSAASYSGPSVLVAIALVALLVTYRPELEPIKSELTGGITALANMLLVIGKHYLPSQEEISEIDQDISNEQGETPVV